MSGNLWAVVGATGTGKSALSLSLAAALNQLGRNTHVVNADAMQFYRGMDIGTAKITAAERATLPHHLFDVLTPAEESTVAWYQPAARALMTEILARGDDVILVGGSGLYVSSAIYDFQFPPRDEALRAELEHKLERDGLAALIHELTERAPETAQAIDLHNSRRVVRALELALLGAEAHATLPPAPTLWHRNTRIIGVHCERSVLVNRLDQRVERMWADGMVAEVRSLIPHGIENGKTASRAIGYAQALAQLNGSLTEAEAIAETQALTRRYARRQVSWFKRYPEIEWIDGPDVSLIRPPLAP